MKVDITFITTLSPFSAKIRGANSEPRYASRLYRALVANSATAGVGPEKEKHVIISAFQEQTQEQTVCFLQEVRNKIRLMGVMKRGDREFELVGELQFKAENMSCVWRLDLVNDVP